MPKCHEVLKHVFDHMAGMVVVDHQSRIVFVEGVYAKSRGLDPHGFADNYVTGLMYKPAIVYAHKFDGKIEYLSGRILPGFGDAEQRLYGLG